MLRKLTVSGAWDLYYVMYLPPTTTIIPSRSPAPNVVIICWGAGHCTHFTHCTVYSVYSGQQPVQGDTGQLRCRCAIVQSQYSVFSARTASPVTPVFTPGLIQFIIQRCLLTSIYRVTPDSDHVDTG